MSLTTELLQLISDRLILYCQPVVGVNSGEAVYYEVLSRFRHPDGGVRCPGQWVVELESMRLGHCLDELVIERTVRYLGESGDKATYSINLSGQTFNHSNQFAKLVRQLVEEFGISKEQLSFEVTETVALEDSELARSTIQFLNSEYKIAIDDFGAGFFTVRSLEQLGPALVKIDGSFARKMPYAFDPDHAEYVCAIIGCSGGAQKPPSKDLAGLIFVSAITQMAHAVGSQVVLEHVETDVQRQWAAMLGVDYLQGYLFGLPKKLGT